MSDWDALEALRVKVRCLEAEIKLLEKERDQARRAFELRDRQYRELSELVEEVAKGKAAGR